MPSAHGSPVKSATSSSLSFDKRGQEKTVHTHYLWTIPVHMKILNKFKHLRQVSVVRFYTDLRGRTNSCSIVYSCPHTSTVIGALLVWFTISTILGVTVTASFCPFHSKV